MHDPMTVAHEIKYPWWRDKPWPKKFRDSADRFERKRHWAKMTDEQKRKRDPMWPEGYRQTFITIWHIDPERGGSDDSCGYSHVRLTKKQRERLQNAAWSEAHNPHFLCCNSKEWTGTHSDAESLYRGLVLFVCRVLRLNLTMDEVNRFACERVHHVDCGKYGGVFCFLPGYHTNSQKDSESYREDHFHGILCNVASSILTMKRHWWQHPKWHFWHWKFQCHPLGDFKRWAFSRCSKCGKGFTWGYAPVTNSWNGSGPLWFRSEKDVFHSDCNRPSDPCVTNAETVTASN